MARCLNRVMVIGSLGREPEMRYMPTGQPVTSFSVGATRAWVDSEGAQCEETEWFNGVAWGELAEICKQRLDKEHRVYVEGRLQTRSWEDRQGKKCFRTELVADEMILLDSSQGLFSKAGEGVAERGT